MGAGAKTVKPLCTCCGKERHPTGAKYPASNATCHRCNCKGHYASQCFSKTVLPADELTFEDDAFLGAVGNEQDCSCKDTVQVGDQRVPFKLDT